MTNPKSEFGDRTLELFDNSKSGQLGDDEIKTVRKAAMPYLLEGGRKSDLALLISRLIETIDAARTSALKWKPKSKQVRVIYGSGEYLNGVDSVTKNPGKVFAVIGPFDGHADKPELQDALEMLLRGYNLERS